jgi:hypothetical protein
MGDAPNRGNSSDLAAHDVLAAEEFAMPAPDPTIRHPPVVLPDDPSGIAEPHDILAAEEFALPASQPHPTGPFVGSPGSGSRRRGAVFGVLGLVLVSRRILRRRRRRRRRRVRSTAV